MPALNRKSSCEQVVDRHDAYGPISLQYTFTYNRISICQGLLETLARYRVKMVANCFYGKRHSIEESHVLFKEGKEVRYGELRYVPEKRQHPLIRRLEIGFPDV
jgi:hypothetical protein